MVRRRLQCEINNSLSLMTSKGGFIFSYALRRLPLCLKTNISSLFHQLKIWTGFFKASSNKNLFEKEDIYNLSAFWQGFLLYCVLEKVGKFRYHPCHQNAKFVLCKIFFCLASLKLQNFQNVWICKKNCKVCIWQFFSKHV